MIGFRDVRYAARELAHAPVRVVVVVLTLAIGIGANSATFSFVRALILRPLPIHDLSRLVNIWETEPARHDLFVEPSYPAFRAWQDRARSFERVAAMSSVNLTFTWSRSGEPRPIRGRVVSAGFFDTLGVAPALGRDFALEETIAGARTRAVVISHALWQKGFGADSSILGQTMTLDGKPFVVIGVMARDFTFPAGSELWMPLVPEFPELATDAGVGWLQVFGRLSPGADDMSARREIEQLVRTAGPQSVNRRAALVPLATEVFGQSRAAVIGLFGATLLILVLACVNVSNVLLAGVVAKRRDHEIRLALGATRMKLIRERFAEAILLTIGGAAAGLAIAYLTLGTLKRLAPADFVHLDDVAIDGSVLLLTAGLLVATALLVSLAPVLAMPAVITGISSAPVHTATPRERRFRRAFVVSQVAAALVVLVASSLTVRSLIALNREDLGFDPDRVLTFAVEVPDARYPTPASKRAFYETLIDRIRSLPDVSAAGAALLRPLEYGAIGMDAPIVVEGQPLTEESERRNPFVNWEVVTPDYFRALGVKLLAGRYFEATDRADGPAVVVIGERTARTFWPKGTAVGKRLSTLDGTVDGRGEQRWQTVVGVVSDVRYRELTGTRLDVYLPYTQTATTPKSVVVRTRGNPLDLIGAMRTIVRDLDREQPIDALTTMGDVVARARAPWRFNATLFGVFGALALLLAAIGVFGVVMCGVAERVREIGIRRALGAQRRDIVSLIARQTSLLLVTGIAAGVTIALLAVRGLSSLLYGVRPVDAWSFVAAAALLVSVAVLATSFPIRKALRTDPLVALRSGTE
jgi:putative ABC transport system permease protein